MSIAEISFFRAVLVQQWRSVRCRAILLAPDTHKKKKRKNQFGLEALQRKRTENVRSVSQCCEILLGGENPTQQHRRIRKLITTKEGSIKKQKKQHFYCRAVVLHLLVT